METETGVESDRPRDDEIQAFHNQIRAADAEKLEFVGEKVSDRVRIALESWFQIFWKVDHQLKCVFGHWSRLYCTVVTVVAFAL